MPETDLSGFRQIAEGSNKIVGYRESEPDEAVAYVKKSESHRSRYERFGQTYCDLLKATHDLANTLFPRQFNKWIAATALQDDPKFSAMITMERAVLSAGQADSRSASNSEDGKNHRKIYEAYTIGGHIDEKMKDWNAAGIQIVDLSAHNFNFHEDGEIQYVDEIKPYIEVDGSVQWLINVEKCEEYIDNIPALETKNEAMEKLAKWKEAKTLFMKAKKVVKSGSTPS